MTIPNPEAQPENVLEVLAERPQAEEAPETEPLLISFARYNAHECEIDALETRSAKRALRTIRDIGVSIRNQADFASQMPLLEVAPIIDDGEYRALYRPLRDMPDVQVHEAKIERNAVRLFFYMVENIFYLLAIRQVHYRT